MTPLGTPSYPHGMRWLIRTAAAATILAGLVVIGVFSEPRGPAVQAPPVDPARARLALVASPPPDGWSRRAERYVATLNPPMERSQIRDLLQVVDRSARRFGLDPLTVLAVIEVESGFDPWAISEQGSVGLMQLQADTARELAGRVGVPFASDDGLFDPETNVLLGTAYLRELLDSFGDVDRAFAAYNLGPAKVDARAAAGRPAAAGYVGRVWDAIRAFHRRART